MTLTLQLILIILSVFLFLILIKSVKKGKLRSDYALIWLLCSIALIIVAIFPQIAYYAADFIGVISFYNFFTNYCSLYIVCQGINTRRKTKKFNSAYSNIRKRIAR